MWSESIVNDSTSEKLWQASPPAPDPTRYNLTQFSIQLNEVTVGLKEALPPTDCRLRPDQAALEHGLFDKVRCWMTKFVCLCTDSCKDAWCGASSQHDVPSLVYGRGA